MKKLFLCLISLLAFIVGNIYESTASFVGMIKHTGYATSALAKAQAKLIAAFQSSELRYTDPAVYRMFLEQSPIMFPDYEGLRKREDRTVEAYYRKRTSRALSTGRSFGHTGSHGDTGVLTPSWTTYSDTFAISMKQADNNIYSLEEMQMNELENGFKNFIEGNETNATAFLVSNRTHVTAASFSNHNDDLGVFNSSTYVHEVPVSTYWGVNNFNIMFGQTIKTIMQINKYAGTGFSMACDSVAWGKLQYVSAQGKDNANNLSFTLDGITYYHAIKMNALAVALGYTEGFVMAVTSGTI